MRYRIEYCSIYREKEWVNTTHEIVAENNGVAIKKARQFVERKNKKGNKIERCELIGLVRIYKPAIPEVTTRVSLS